MSGLLGDLTDEQLAKMPFDRLMMMRESATPEEQKRLAPYEHRAFMRTILQEKPHMAAPMLVGLLGYQPAKALGAIGARTPPSWDQFKQGAIGYAEGVGGLLGLR